jgi:hypothetical protein
MTTSSTKTRPTHRVYAVTKSGAKSFWQPIGATAGPFFKWMADNAVHDSKINVRNVGPKLFDRYVYLRDSFRTVAAEAETQKHDDEAQQAQREFSNVGHSVRAWETKNTSELVATFTFPWARISQNSSWLALAAIDAFFAWTEHIFIHLAILQGA